MADDTMDLWALDEVHFQQQGSRCRMWVPPENKDPVVYHHPTRKSVGYFAAVRLRDGQFLFRRETGRFNGETFWEFLKVFREVSAVPGRRVLAGIDQLWVADITYIRLETEFVYLAVVLDRYSRRVIGWELDRTLEDDLSLAALRMALRNGMPGPGLVHHSDRGIQYASGDYTDVLKDNKVRISMSRKGYPYDNATCESFMKTLKYEEVYRQEYRDLAEARASIGQFLNKVYNQQRLHSALGYLPPVEFEQSLSPASGSEAVA